MWSQKRFGRKVDREFLLNRKTLRYPPWPFLTFTPPKEEKNFIETICTTVVIVVVRSDSGPVDESVVPSLSSTSSSMGLLESPCQRDPTLSLSPTTENLGPMDIVVVLAIKGRRTFRRRHPKVAVVPVLLTPETHRRRRKDEEDVIISPLKTFNDRDPLSRREKARRSGRLYKRRSKDRM